MLTVEKLKVYQDFAGDIDGWARAAKNGNTEGMTDDDWGLIDELLQALFLVASGRAGPEFRISLDERLGTVTADEATCELLRSIATGDVR